MQDTTATQEEAPRQATLDPVIFAAVKREQIPTVKVTVSGTIELTRKALDALLNVEQVDAGDEVTVSLSGFVLQPGAAWVKRSEGTGDDKDTWWEKEGRIKIKAEGLGAIHVSGRKRSGD